MKFSQLTPLAAAIVALGTPLVSVAQTTATTDPVGFITLNVAAGNTTSGKLTFTGLGLTQQVAYQGNLESVTTNSITDNDATWTTDQFDGANGKYYVELTSGTGLGTTYDISTTTAHTITLAQNLAGGVVNGDTFKIRKHWTIASVFGANDESGLGGGNSSTADQILLFNGTGYDVYFYQLDAQIGNGWRSANDLFTDASGTVLYPEEGIIVKRKQASAVNVVLMGSVKAGQTSFPIFAGTNIVSNIYAAPMTLGDSGLFTNNSATGVATGNSSTADQILIYNGTGYDVYFYQVDAQIGNGWRSANDLFTDASSTQIPVGASIIVKRKGATGFNWVIPQHPATL
jgi:uncharacterized protein (TIGR02597 family)